MAATLASSPRSIPSCRALQATARYIAPVSMCRYPRRAATARATVPFPAPDGPSMATIKALLLTLLLSSAMRPKAISLAIATVLLLAAGDLVMRTYGRGAAFVVQAVGIQGVARRVAGWQAVPVSETLDGYAVPWRGGVREGHSLPAGPRVGGGGVPGSRVP